MKQDVLIGQIEQVGLMGGESNGSLEGYMATRILAKALNTIKGTPTRESIIDALQRLGKLDVGLGHLLHLSAKDHQASHRVWPRILQHGEFVPFKWADINKLVQGFE